MLHRFDGIFNRHGGDGGLVLLGCGESCCQDSWCNERACAIMNHNPLAGGCDLHQRIQSSTDGILATETPWHNGGNFAPLLMVAELGRGRKTFGTHDQDNGFYYG